MAHLDVESRKGRARDEGEETHVMMGVAVVAEVTHTRRGQVVLVHAHHRALVTDKAHVPARPCSLRSHIPPKRRVWPAGERLEDGVASLAARARVARAHVEKVRGAWGLCARLEVVGHTVVQLKELALPVAHVTAAPVEPGTIALVHSELVTCRLGVECIERSVIHIVDQTRLVWR